mgnify:CR=1 FL=1
MSFTQSNLGGGIKGKQTLLIGHVDSGSERASSRKHLAKAFGNLYNSGLGTSPALNSKNVLGPFRTSYNAGDVTTNSIVNTDIKYGREANQVGGNNLSRVSGKPDGVSRNGSGMYSGNPRYVYDGSDYTKFKKFKQNKNCYLCHRLWSN